MEMEFWGVEVKSGEPVKCNPGEHNYVHLSQVALGEIKKDKPNETIPLYVKTDNKKLVIGTLSTEKCTQISLDLVFEKEFELSHSWKNGSVYFCGYKSTPEDEDDEDSDSEPEDLIPLVTNENGKPEVKAEQPKPAADKAKAGKPIAGLAIPKPKGGPDVDDDDDDDDSEDEDESDDDDEDDDEEMLSSDEDEDEDDSANEETPEKADKSKKRPQESATKTPGPEKKAKLVSPDGGKTGPADGKKGGGHVATPYPTKTAAKTPADKPKQQTPNSQAKKFGQVTCTTCSKTFGTEQALDSHTKAKHSAASK